MNEIKKDLVNDELSVKGTKAKKTTTKVIQEENTTDNNNNELIKMLREMNAKLQAQIDELKSAKQDGVVTSQQQVVQSQPIVIQSPKEKKYTIVNLTSDHNFLLLEAGNWVGTFRGYCDTREVNEETFLEIVRKYATFFTLGDIATDKEGTKILQERGIKFATRWLTTEELRHIGDLTIQEIIDLLKQLIPAQKDLFVEEFLNGVSRGDANFTDINKLMAISQNYKGYKTQSLLNAINKIIANQ